MSNTMESLINTTDIPFKHVTWAMYVSLANKLDPDSVFGNNWRMLAEKLGYSMQNILVFESQQASHGRNTIKVLQDYSLKQGSTVNRVYRALEEMGRPDALDELKAGLPGVEIKYKQELEAKQGRQKIDETNYICPSCNDGSVPSESFLCPQHNNTMMPSSRLCPYHGFHSPIRGKFMKRPTNVDTLAFSNRLPGSGHHSPECKWQLSTQTDSMLVINNNSHSHHICSSMETMDHTSSFTENPVPPAVAFMRIMPQFSSQLSDCPSITSTSNVDANFRQGCGHGLPLEKSLKLNISPPSDKFGMHKYTDFVSPSPTPTSTPSTPLGHLQQVVNLCKSQSESETGYNNLMKIKHDEERIQEQSCHEGNPCPQGICCREHESSLDQTVTFPVSPKNAQPNTFPLRLKSSTPTSASSQPLLKSVSVPSNMKPVEFRKAYRHIKVFVTYADDNKEHIKRVLNLCTCLERNGFMCCVDIFHRKLLAKEREDWHHIRFKEADFILVVISPKYKQEADSSKMENDARDDNNDDNECPYQLHTKDIYRLMYQEYVQIGSQDTRFIPLLFKGATRDIIPQWMLENGNKLVYNWPEQFKDLLWMLSKPDRHVPECSVLEK